jgi:membrane protease subunit HflK
VQSVNLQDIQPPEAVQPAFEDAIRAREDEQRYISEASAYANKVVPRARGTAAQLVEQAKGYESKVTNEALGDASRFEQLLKSYKMAPDITRERMYLDAVSGVLSKNKSIVVDSGSGNNVFYLPLGGSDTRPSSVTKSVPDMDSLPLPNLPSQADNSNSRGNLTSDDRGDLRSRSAQ